MMFLIGGNIGVAMLSFVRNVLIARMLSVEDFGIAATFSIVISFVGLAGNFAVDRFLIQSHEGDERHVQATVHIFEMLRGVAGAMVLFVLAVPIAVAFNVPEIAWAYQLMALIPLMRGLVHFDIARVQRRMWFLPITLTELVPHLIATTLIIPFAWYLEDYRAVLLVILLQNVSYVVVSHLVAKRRYQWQFDRAVFRRILTFGGPLVVGGLLLFATLQGDRFTVGALLSVETLGWFSAAFMVTSVPAGVVGRVCLTIFLPILSAARNDTHNIDRWSATMINLGMVLGVLYAVAVALAVPSLLLLLFGERYAPGLYILPWLAAIQGVHIARVAPATVAMACGDTMVLLFASIVRTAFMVAGFFAVWTGAGLTGLMISGLAGELAAYGVSMILLHKRTEVAIGSFVLPASMSLLIIAATVLGSFEWVTGQQPGTEIAATFPVAMVALVLCLTTMPGLIRDCRAMWQN